MSKVYAIHCAVNLKKKRLNGQMEDIESYTCMEKVFDSLEKANQYLDSRPYALFDAINGRKCTPLVEHSKMKRLWKNKEYCVTEIEVE